MTPDQLKALFDSNAIIIMFVIGLVYKYVPQFKALPNAAIPFLNAILYILTKFFVPDAHAGLLDGVPGAIGCLIGGFTNAIWARQLYEGFGRALVEKVLKLKNPAAA